MLSRSTYYRGVRTIEEYILKRSTYYRGVRVIEEYVL